MKNTTFKKHYYDLKWWLFRPLFGWIIRINYSKVVQLPLFMAIDLGTDFRKLAFEKQGAFKCIQYLLLGMDRFDKYVRSYYKGLADSFVITKNLHFYENWGAHKCYESNEKLLKGVGFRVDIVPTYNPEQPYKEELVITQHTYDTHYRVSGKRLYYKDKKVVSGVTYVPDKFLIIKVEPVSPLNLGL